MSERLKHALKPGNLIHGIEHVSEPVWAGIVTSGLKPAARTGNSTSLCYNPNHLSFAIIADGRNYHNPYDAYRRPDHVGPIGGMSNLHGFDPELYLSYYFGIAIIVNREKLLASPLGAKLYAVGSLLRESAFVREYHIENGQAFGMPYGPGDQTWPDEVQLRNPEPEEVVDTSYWEALIVYTNHRSKLQKWNEKIGGPILDVPVFVIAQDGKAILE